MFCNFVFGSCLLPADWDRRCWSFALCSTKIWFCWKPSTTNVPHTLMSRSNSIAGRPVRSIRCAPWMECDVLSPTQCMMQSMTGSHWMMDLSLVQLEYVYFSGRGEKNCVCARLFGEGRGRKAKCNYLITLNWCRCRWTATADDARTDCVNSCGWKCGDGAAVAWRTSALSPRLNQLSAEAECSAICSLMAFSVFALSMMMTTWTLV